MVFLPDNPSCYDAGVEAQIRSNGGRNDVITIRMWFACERERARNCERDREKEREIERWIDESS